jgi:hypothetical protein
VNRFVYASTIARGLAICGLLVATTLTGCSAGQQSQTATTEPAVNGSSATSKNIALRDVRIRAVQTGDALNAGKTVEVVAVATNQDPTNTDRLVAISQDIGQITLSGDTTVPPLGTLLLGTPDRAAAAALADVAPTSNARAALTLTTPISNGLLYNFTFHFERAGNISLVVPIAAGAEAPRQQQAAAP